MARWLRICGYAGRFALSRRVSSRSAAGRRVAVSTDAWRTAPGACGRSVRTVGVSTDGHGRAAVAAFPGLTCAPESGVHPRGLTLWRRRVCNTQEVSSGEVGAWKERRAARRLSVCHPAGLGSRGASLWVARGTDISDLARPAGRGYHRSRDRP
jgi:hypothetical protein